MSWPVPCKTEDQRPEPLGGSGDMLPRKFLELKSPRSAFSCEYIKTLLLFWTGILIFVNSKGNEDQRGKSRSSRN